MIRAYQPADLEALREITAICFAKVSIDANIEAQFGPIGGRDWRWRKLRHIDQDVDGDRARGVFVWEEEGQVQGYITTRTDPESRIGWIPNLAVRPEHQSRGLGRQLMDHALEYLRQQGMEAAKIETLAQNAVGSQFYPSTGFTEVARQIHYLMRL
ncbi:MAG: GNAT family N-acetyltransferase [Candidatus Latescibacteria bacterium]|nr:GNAT family N-acetyltransferase [Candidatus Latescibacterota bacterium]